jgi:DNA-binding beta-propeller fold protein YncE
MTEHDAALAIGGRNRPLGSTRRTDAVLRIPALTAGAIAAAILALPACTPSDHAIPTGSVSTEYAITSVEVTPAVDTVHVGGTIEFTAITRNFSGVPIIGRTISWSSTDESVLTVDSEGTATGVGPGSASVVASVDAASGSAQVTAAVLPVPTIQEVYPTTGRVMVRWSSSTNPSFYSYELYRDTQPNVTRQSTPIDVLADPADTTCFDSTTLADQEYYYRVFEVSDDGASAGSDHVAANLIPHADLGDFGFDVAVDDARALIYVSLPNRNEIALVSQATSQVVDRVIVGSRPHGIDISDDGSTLWIALNGAGSVAALDLNSLAVTEVIVGDSLGYSRAYDVVEGEPHRVFVSANPGSGGFAWIVMISVDQGNAYRRVASDDIIRADPVFAKSPDRTALYIGEGFSPNSLYRLDLADPAAPITLEDDHGSVSGTSHMSVSPDGARIYLESGQVLYTSTFIQAGQIGSGISEAGLDGNRVFVGTCARQVQPGFCSLEAYDATAFTLVNTIRIEPVSPSRLRPTAGGVLWVLAGDELYPLLVP